MLKGETVKLRPVKIDDLTFLNQWRNDYEVFKFLGGGYNPISIDQQREWMTNFVDNTGGVKRFIIEKDQQPVGLIGIYDINHINGTTDFGMYIGDRDEWGKGIGTEATALLINYAFLGLNLRKVKLNVLSKNNGAKKVYKRLGFTHVGTLYKDRFVEGKYEDVDIMELFKEEFKYD